MRSVRVATTVTSVVLVVAGMAGEPAARRAAQPAGAAPVATLTQQGLFPVQPPFLPSGPSVAVYADGTVLTPDKALPTVAPQIWPYRIGRVGTTVVETLVSRARTLGLLEDRGAYPPMDVRAIGAMPHASQTIVVLSTAAGTFRHVADGLSPSDTDARRVALRRFSGELSALSVHAGEWYQPARIAVVAAPVAADPRRPQVDWPGTQVDLSRATVCTMIDDGAVVRFLSAQTSGVVYRQGGRFYRLAARVVLPGGGC